MADQLKKATIPGCCPRSKVILRLSLLILASTIYSQPLNSLATATLVCNATENECTLKPSNHQVICTICKKMAWLLVTNIHGGDCVSKHTYEMSGKKLPYITLPLV